MNDFLESNFYELSELQEVITEMPLTSFFVETKERASKQTFGSWLETVDTDTIKMLLKVAEKTLYGETPEKPFTPQEEDEAIDYLYLVLFALGFELKSEIIPKNLLDKSMSLLYVLVIAEDLKRAGLCEVQGNNALLDNDTKMALTTKGKLLMEDIRRKGK